MIFIIIAWIYKKIPVQQQEIVMKEKLEYYQKILVDHYMVVLLVMALMPLTIAGIGSRRIVGLNGCVL